MKLLFLVRHAKSSWEDPTLDDHDRPLSDRGRKNAPEMVGRLNAWRTGPQVILSSSALRAFKTAEYFADGLESHPRLEVCPALYTDSAKGLLKVIKAVPPQIEYLMVICHNPAINELVNQLGLRTDNVPTCGVVVFGLEVDSWQAVCQKQVGAIYFDYPKRKNHT
ncbi:SixA phosphatase family protein [Photobacterium atrarenae]|uniref:Histidine phosphatase family protein n=1 Tax=Photobacterium atrarenae TaxID=865757 RepID=A0ABY5GQP5_9GAMM|nr:histidine phosphatase family protein [Photobacterium atrarenae]UTV30583.1 histidine phosphatase family protein [Photobacterium atrarenae]